MKHMTLHNITTACHGVYCGSDDLLQREIAGVAIDSRKIEKDFLFVPIKGAKVDGHSFIPQVMEAGALCTLSEQDIPEAGYPYIKVDSSEQALMALAVYYRNYLEI